MRQYFSTLAWQTKPRYGELSAYLTALSCAICFIAYPDFWSLYGALLCGGAFTGLSLITTAGFVLSLVHVFIRRRRSNWEKLFMGAFVTGANGLAGVVAGVEMLSGRWTLLAVFPIWNMMLGIFLLYRMALARFEISDQDASLTEVGIGTFTLLAVYGVLRAVSHASWALTFSVCLLYSSAAVFAYAWVVRTLQVRREEELVRARNAAARTGQERAGRRGRRA